MNPVVGSDGPVSGGGTAPGGGGLPGGTIGAELVDSVSVGWVGSLVVVGCVPLDVVGGGSVGIDGSEVDDVDEVGEVEDVDDSVVVVGGGAVVPQTNQWLMAGIWPFLPTSGPCRSSHGGTAESPRFPGS